MIIAIDGGAGTGKTTVGIFTAQKLNFQFLDTGKIYRAFTWYVIDKYGEKYTNHQILTSIDETEIQYKYSMPGEQIFINNKPISKYLNSKLVEKHVSLISKVPEVRKSMTQLQREIVIRKNFVVAGRDIGTVVLPKADLKIFLVASIEERTKRRFVERKHQSYEKTLQSINNRDFVDKNRSLAPLKASKDAITIDTEFLDIDEVSNRIISLIKS